MNPMVKLAVIGALAAVGGKYLAPMIAPHTASFLGAQNDLVVSAAAAAAVAVLAGKVL